MQRTESLFKSFDGTQIFYQSWEKPEALGTIVFTHGQGEHSESYVRLIEGLKDVPWNFIGWDLRGHGRSEGKRGFATGIDDYCKDFEVFLNHLLQRPQYAKKKKIFLAHSMGGLIFLKSNFLFKLPQHEAAVLSAPLLGVAVAVPLIKDIGAVFLKQVLPTLTLGNEIKNTDLTRDPDVIADFEKDTLRHHKISAGVYLSMLENFPWVMERASQFKTPFLLQISDNDPVVSSKKALEFFDKAGSEQKFKIVYSGGKHESYNDTHRQSAFSDVREFLEKFVK